MNINQKKEVLSLLNYALESVPAEKFKWIGQETNLKLYDAACYTHQDERFEEDWFHHWCDDVYYFEYLPKLNPKDIRVEHVGSSSTFYYVPEHGGLFSYVDIDDYDEVDDKGKRLYAFLDFLMYEYNFEAECEDIGDKSFKNVLGIREYQDYYDLSFEEACEDLSFLSQSPEGLANEFKHFCNETLNEINEMYEYLENFKKNQVERFEEYINHRLEEMDDED